MTGAVHLHNKLYEFGPRQLLVNSLVDSARSLSSVVLVTLILWTVFAIIGTTFFKGLFWHCSDSTGLVAHRMQCTGAWVGDDGQLRTRLWQNPHANFDNFGEAMFALFALSTNNDWVLTAHRAIDGTGVDLQPAAEYAPVRMLFFVLFIVISNFFFMNLFVGGGTPKRQIPGFQTPCPNAFKGAHHYYLC